MSYTPVDPSVCPTPIFHETHRYCPSCTWTEQTGFGDSAAQPESAFRAGGQGFGQQFAEHVAPGAFLGVGEFVDFGERGGAESDRDVISRGLLRGHDGSVAQCCTMAHERATLSHMTTIAKVRLFGGLMNSNSTLYRRSQVNALEKISDVTARAWRAHLPEITWNIGLTGAFGRCPDLATLRQYAMGLGCEVVEHRSHWTANIGNGLHLRFDVVES